MAEPSPLNYVFYIAGPPEKVWEGYVSPQSNRIIFTGAEFKGEFKPGGALAWVGPGKDGKPVNYVHGKVLRFEPPRVFEYTFAMGASEKESRVTVELVAESEATKVTVTHDKSVDTDPT